MMVWPTYIPKHGQALANDGVGTPQPPDDPLDTEKSNMCGIKSKNYDAYQHCRHKSIDGNVGEQHANREG